MTERSTLEWQQLSVHRQDGAGDVLEDAPETLVKTGVVLTIPIEEQKQARTATGSPRYRKLLPRYDDQPLAELLCIEPVEESRPSPRDINRELPKPILGV